MARSRTTRSIGRRARTSWLAGLCAALVSSGAWAQADDAQADDAQADDAQADDAQADDAQADDAPLDPLAQRPEPVLDADTPDPPSRLVEVGPFFGYTLRPSDGSAVSYGAAPTWGAYFRPELTSWLGARLYYRQESIPVSVPRGGLELADWPLGSTDFDQPNLSLRSLGARLEPTWVVNPRLRLSGIVGIAWLRIAVPAPVSRGQLHVQTASRAGVELNTVFGASVTVDVVPDWLAASLGVTHGTSFNSSGSAYDTVQAFADGQRLFLGALPRFRNVTDILLSVGVVL